MLLHEDKTLSSFLLALKGEGSDENYDNNIEILLNFELSIVPEIALPIQNEIVKLKHLSHPFNFYREFFYPDHKLNKSQIHFYPVNFPENKASVNKLTKNVLSIGDRVLFLQIYCQLICNLHSTADAPLRFFYVMFQKLVVPLIKMDDYKVLINFMLKISVINFFLLKNQKNYVRFFQA